MRSNTLRRRRPNRHAGRFRGEPLQLTFIEIRRESVDRVEVRWLGSAVESFENIQVDRVVTLTEGATRGEPRPLDR